MKTCSMCGRAINEGVACPYQRQGLSTCRECCEKCYQSEPFPCREYEERAEKEVQTLNKGVYEELAASFKITEGEARSMVIYYAIFSEYGDAFFNNTGKLTTMIRTVKALWKLERRFRKNPKAVFAVIHNFVRIWRESGEPV